eukprot:2473872-Amphidinium_carterae.1
MACDSLTGGPARIGPDRMQEICIKQHHRSCQGNPREASRTIQPPTSQERHLKATIGFKESRALEGASCLQPAATATSFGLRGLPLSS